MEGLKERARGAAVLVAAIMVPILAVWNFVIGAWLAGALCTALALWLWVDLYRWRRSQWQR